MFRSPARWETQVEKREVTATEVHCSSDWNFFFWPKHLLSLPIADLPSLPRLALHHKDAQTPWRGRTWPPGAPVESPREPLSPSRLSLPSSSWAGQPLSRNDQPGV